MLDQKFCDFLEMRLTENFPQSDNISLRGFWCDGILLPDNEQDLSIQTVSHQRAIVMHAFCGFDGQDKIPIITSV